MRNKIAIVIGLLVFLTICLLLNLSTYTRPAMADTKGTAFDISNPANKCPTAQQRLASPLENTCTGLSKASHVHLADCICEDFRTICIAWVRGVCNQWIDECVKQYCN